MVVERPAPAPGPGEVRIRVRAAGCNRADLVQVAGHYPPPPGATDILGLECAGEIDAVGPGVDPARVGERVAALLVGGGQAEQVCCPAGHALPIGALGWAQAAALPEVWATAWLNLVGEAALRPGERVLLHAGASGVGTAAIQLCRWLGARAWAVAGGAEKIARCVALGADGGTDRHAGDWRADARAWSEGRGVDVILDPVGGSTVADGVASLATGGRLVLIGLMGGREARLDLGRVLVKRLRLVGSTLRARPDEEKAALMAALAAGPWPDLLAGRLAPVIDAVLPLEEVAAAHARLAGDGTVGKVVLAL